MENKLINELLELSKEVRDYNNVTSNGAIIPTLELGEEISIPYHFKARVFAPGFYKGFHFTAADIKRNMHSIFKKTDNIANNELNIDHKNNRKMDSSIFDLAGQVTNVSFDESDDELWMECDATNRVIAEMIANRTIKYVSLRINPTRVEYENGLQYARDFDFEELSLVRTPAYNKGRIEFNDNEV